MNYTECKFFTKQNTCSHKDAPQPFHSACIGKEQCEAWHDSIDYRGLDQDSPIYKAAPEMYEALKALKDALMFLKGDLRKVLGNAEYDALSEAYSKGYMALTKAEGKVTT